MKSAFITEKAVSFIREAALSVLILILKNGFFCVDYCVDFMYLDAFRCCQMLFAENEKSPKNLEKPWKNGLSRAFLVWRSGRDSNYQ